MTEQAPGRVDLIGAGPGDPGLLTLRGLEQLRQADIVLFDSLVAPAVLALCDPRTEQVCVGKHGQTPIWSQDEINARMIAEARQGRHVARLKGGDPTIFGRLADEIAALEEAGIPYRVTPGVTAAAAASAYTGIPLTHRDHASCLAIVTGQQGTDPRGEPLDYAALANFPGTLVFYMGVTSVARWSQALVNHGKDPATPAAVIRHASLPRQQTITTTLGDLPHILEPGKIRPPVTVLIGAAVAARAACDWFGSQRLAGRCVLITRPAGQSASLAGALSDLGAEVRTQPAIAIEPPLDWGPLDSALDRLPELDWVVFSSANGVASFLDRLQARGRDLRALGGVGLATIGPATSAALAARGLQADLQPAVYRAEALADALVERLGGRAGRVLLVRASRGREVLAETLRAAGVEVLQAVAYRSLDVGEAEPSIAAALAAGQFDWTTVTSSAIARALVALFGEELRKTRLVAISPLTGEVLSAAGYPPAAVAATYDAAGIVAAIQAAEGAE